MINIDSLNFNTAILRYMYALRTLIDRMMKVILWGRFQVFEVHCTILVKLRNIHRCPLKLIDKISFQWIGNQYN